MATIITPSDEGLQKGVAQIYPIVNDVFKQMTGREDIQAVDTASFVAMGQSIKMMGQTELWLNTLTRRIGATIDAFRPYRNRFSELARTQLEWGAIVQKITAEMPEATLDKTWDVGMMDGQSVDQWIINNPKVHQVFFDKEAAYTFFITIQTKLLNRAFLSESAMQALITQIFGKVRNKIEFTNEELARLAVANCIINLPPKQEFHLVSMYNSATGSNLDSLSCRYDAAFLRFVNATINQVSRKMETMSILYNAEGKDRFTPQEDQKFYMLADFMTFLETVPEYQATNAKYKQLSPDILVPYWQANHTDGSKINDWSNISSIQGTLFNGKQRKVTNLIAFLFDKEVLGTFRRDEETLTTPVNARARYYNTFWHSDNFWFNMTDENAVAFYLD